MRVFPSWRVWVWGLGRNHLKLAEHSPEKWKKKMEENAKVKT